MIHLLLYAIGLLAITAGNLLTGMYLGEYFTEIRKPILNFKPFNCRPCFTFWSTFFLGCLLYGRDANAPVWLIAGMALVVALLGYTIVNSKYKIYE